jgi:hypothetical protein
LKTALALAVLCCLVWASGAVIAYIWLGGLF